MKIAIAADPFIPIPPEHYGGIERVIDFLVTGLRARGHDVLLAAHKASKVDVPLLPYKGAGATFASHMRTINALYDWRPDIIHNFGRLAYLLPVLFKRVPKIMSYQREPTITQIKKALFLSKKGTLTFTGCSDHISDQIRPVAAVRTIYNGVPMEKYTFRKRVSDDAPLIFLGRIEPIKGAHHAVEVALRTGRKLTIAGNIPNEYTSYFKERIEPFLGPRIEYVGAVNDHQKNALLGDALALLMPINWEEPFGIVMAEAMACGTPVIGFDRGAVPEVIDHGSSGLICRDIDDMFEAVRSVNAIDRLAVREHCETHFSADVIIEDHIRLYDSLI